ncbi:hypothetical protein QQ045_032868 [Rhodiola kirilowii]
MKALVDHSLETVVKWDTEEIDGEYIQVNRVFWEFAECNHAFKHCHPILSIDGTHMYGKYDAKLLVAFSLDANNGVVHIAFALVESENTSSWSRFMRCIREGVTSRQGLCVISDRHGEIIAAIKEPEWSPPMAYHRICVHHFQSNFNTKVKDSYLKKKLGKVTTGTKHHLWKVCLPERTCDCGKWTTLHIPCSHSIAAYKFANREYIDYVPHEYTLQAYNMTWSYHFSPLPDSDFWEPYYGLPHRPNPHFKRTNVGRNPTRRRRTEMDQRDVGQ